MSFDTRAPFETPWILRDPAAAPRVGPDPSLRLFCLPQAGCGAWAFHGLWQTRLPPHVEVLPVEYPGRNSRLRHLFEYQSLQDLASAIVDAIEPLLPADADASASRGVASKRPANPPYALLGWSMGAWLGYEMVLEIARRGHSALPLRVYLGGSRSPSLAGPEFDPDRETPALSALPKRLFWEAFARRYGANADLEASEALRDLLLPTLRRDFALMERYAPSTDPREAQGSESRCLGRRDERVAAARLPVPLVAFGAHGDARYFPQQLSAWRDVAALDHDRNENERCFFLERWFRGGRATPHRLVLDAPDDLLRFLSEAFGG